MRAELMVVGKPVDLSLRARRRVLVSSIYATLLILIGCVAWLSRTTDALHLGGICLVCFTLMVNRFLLGGYAHGGLIHPFSNQAPAQTTMPPPYILLGLYLHLSDPSDRDWRNDERELQLRDHAHYQAYQIIATVLAILWLSTGWSNKINGLLTAWLHVPAGAALYLFALSAALLAITLPQAILLWNEPDMSGFVVEEK